MASHDLNYSRLENGLLLDCTTTWSAELMLSALKNLGHDFWLQTVNFEQKVFQLDTNGTWLVFH